AGPMIRSLAWRVGRNTDVQLTARQASSMRSTPVRIMPLAQVIRAIDRRTSVNRIRNRATAISRLGTTAATPAAAMAKSTAATTVLAGLEADSSLIYFGSKACIGGRTVGA